MKNNSENCMKFTAKKGQRQVSVMQSYGLLATCPLEPGTTKPGLRCSGIPGG